MLEHYALMLPWLAVVLILSALYVRAYRKAARIDSLNRHPRWKLLLFHAGLLALLIAVFSPVEYHGNRVLWVDLTSFLLITMIAAPLLLLGSPLTLAFRISGPIGRRRLRWFYRSTLMRVLTFPIFSWLAFAIATYVWQFTKLPEFAARHVLVRDVEFLTLILVSLCFWLPALCADPLRWRMSYPLRVLYVFVELAHKALFGAMFLSMDRPFHTHFASNPPSWAPSAIMDQRYGILIAWMGGNVIFMLTLAFLIARWMQYEGRNQHRIDYRLALAREAERRRRAALDQVFRKPV
jgi:putative copper resistance protein D